MSKRVIKSHPTDRVLSAAIVAYRTNGNRVITHRLVEKVNGESIVRTENTQQILSLLNSAEPFDPDEELLAETQLLRDKLQNYLTLSILKENDADYGASFIRKVTTLLEKDTIPESRLGSVIYAPKVKEDIIKKEEELEKMSTFIYSSKSLGPNKSTVSVNFTLIDTKYIDHFGFYAVFGHDGYGNLVSFATSDQTRCRSMQLTGRIKQSGPDKYHNNLVVTQLHYIREPKDLAAS